MSRRSRFIRNQVKFGLLNSFSLVSAGDNQDKKFYTLLKAFKAFNSRKKHHFISFLFENPDIPYNRPSDHIGVRNGQLLLFPILDFRNCMSGAS